MSGRIECFRWDRRRPAACRSLQSEANKLAAADYSSASGAKEVHQVSLKYTRETHEQDGPEMPQVAQIFGDLIHAKQLEEPDLRNMIIFHAAGLGGAGGSFL